jgi:hypothetical protein
MLVRNKLELGMHCLGFCFIYFSMHCTHFRNKYTNFNPDTLGWRNAGYLKTLGLNAALMVN